MVISYVQPLLLLLASLFFLHALHAGSVDFKYCNGFNLPFFVTLAMDRAWGSKPGSGGAASRQNEAIDRRERLRRLALETINLANDPYFLKNHLGTYECILCATLHNNEGNYLAHTQGKRHQISLAKRAAREAKDAPAKPQPLPHKSKVSVRKTIKIGKPGYRVTKQYDPELKQRCILFQIEYPEIDDNIKPRHRFMSSYEQKVQPYDKRYQYLLFAAEPYETISFKVCFKSNKPQFTVVANGPPPPPPMANGLWPIPPPPPPPPMWFIPPPPPPANM